MLNLLSGNGLNYQFQSISQDIYTIAIEDHNRRLGQMKTAWERYHGIWPKPLNIITEQRPSGRITIDDNVVVNMVRTIVDKGVSFLYGSEVEFQTSLTADTREEVYLAEVWRKSGRGKMATLKGLAVNGAITGHCFARLVPGRLPKDPPRIVVLDPANVTPIPDPEDCENALGYIIEWSALRPQQSDRHGNFKRLVECHRQIIERDEQSGKWMIRDWRSVGDSPYTPLNAPQMWPWEWCPIIDWQNIGCPNEYWGISDVEPDVIALNEAVNFVLSNQARITRYHAHPKMYITGATAGEIEFGVSDILTLADVNARVGQLELGSGPAVAENLYDRLMEALYQITRTPPVALGKMNDVGALSGRAMQVLYQPLIEKTETKRGTHSWGIEEINQRLLEMGGFARSTTYSTSWPEILPSDAVEETEVLAKHLDLGVSKHTILTKLGYDPEVEAERKAQEAEDAMERQQEMMADAQTTDGETPTEAETGPVADAPDNGTDGGDAMPAANGQPARRGVGVAGSGTD